MNEFPSIHNAANVFKELRDSDKEIPVSLERSKKNLEKTGVERRLLLKGITALSAAFALRETDILNALDNIFNEKLTKNLGIKKDSQVSQAEPEITEDYKTIDNFDDAKSIREIISFDSPDLIKIDMETMASLQEYWIKQFSDKKQPKHRDSLMKAYNEIAPWEKFLKFAFEKNKIPKELMYLSIPESYCNYYAVSPSGAVGPYQFTKETGLLYGLKINEEIDERFDPIKSGNACAKLLSDLRKKSNGSWDLALSGYNGSYIWEFLRSKDKINISYTEFLRFIEDKINDLRDGIKGSEFIIHKTKKGDSLLGIADKYGITMRELIKANNTLETRNLRINQEIKIPLLNHSQRKKYFDSQVADYAQNLNYPAKYYAVMHMIQNDSEIKEVASKRKVELPAGYERISEINKNDSILDINKYRLYAQK